MMQKINLDVQLNIEKIQYLDPRNKDLGARLIINLEKLYLSLKN